MRAVVAKWTIFLFVTILWGAISGAAGAAQRELLKLPVGYTPISGAALPFLLRWKRSSFKSMDWMWSLY
jgi:hypothetical protein